MKRVKLIVLLLVVIAASWPLAKNAWADDTCHWILCAESFDPALCNNGSGPCISYCADQESFGDCNNEYSYFRAQCIDLGEGEWKCKCQRPTICW